LLQDDNWNADVGPSEVVSGRAADGKYTCIADMGLSAKDMQDVTKEWQATVLAVQQSLMKKNKFGETMRLLPW